MSKSSKNKTSNKKPAQKKRNNKAASPPAEPKKLDDMDVMLGILLQSNIGRVTSDSDRECAWIRIEQDGMNIEFSFDSAGLMLDGITVTKDVIEVTSEDVLADFKNKLKPPAIQTDTNTNAS